MTLEKLTKGQTAKITVVGGDGALRQHFLDMGVIPGAEISFVKPAPMGDPIEFQIHGYELTLRVDDAKKIECEYVEMEKENAVTVSAQDEKTEQSEAPRIHW